jgi:CRISPR-associated endonuclease/helicase Cas3
MMIPSELNPTHMDDLKAKSRDFGGDTLAEHTWAVLSRLADQYQLHPHLAEQVGDERLWHRLYWTCFLHDFGKAAQGFQERLQDEPIDNDWKQHGHRHEVLSLAFIDWLFPSDHVDRVPVAAAIASHHKDLDSGGMIFLKYGAGGRSEDSHQLEFIHYLVEQISDEVVDKLWVWLEQYALRWQEHLGLPTIEAVHPTNRAAFGMDAIMQALDDVSLYLRDFGDGMYPYHDLFRNLIYRGLILTSDHAASAGVGSFPAFDFDMTVAEKPLADFDEPRTHQKIARDRGSGSAIMIAPTGSGKTEAAMLWAARQMEYRPAARLFYVLPYQASMNAMAERICDRYFELKFTAEEQDQVALNHSRAVLKFYKDLMDSEEDPKAATDAAMNAKNKVRLNFYPIQICSPYQILKAAYSLKGYETLLLDYTNALFIFDEIHAYDARRTALIITMMRWLRENFGARFLVMTATLPPMVREQLQTALGVDNDDIIEADDALYKQSQRHEVRIHAGDLLTQLEGHIDAELAENKAILITCNRIATARAVHALLAGYPQLQDDNLILLHGRFNGGDRKRLEDRLIAEVPTGRDLERDKPFVVVSTQVVEVSLDIDMDTIYTDPAPLEALLQRFGRVNRGRTGQLLCPVHVFTEPSNPTDSKNAYLPYAEQIVRRSVEELDKLHKQPIDESQVNNMLCDIYADEIYNAWMDEYETAADDFERIILAEMKPYESASPAIWGKFYEMFEGIQVLPEASTEAYADARKRSWIEASEYLVSLSIQKWEIGRFLKSGVMWDEGNEKQGLFVIDAPYDPDNGLDLETARARAKEKLGK